MRCHLPSLMRRRECSSRCQTIADRVYSLNSYMGILFKITHAGTFNTSIQALNLIFQVSQAQQAASDRFHRTLYDSLFDGRLITSSKQAMYLNLLFKALKADPSVARVMAFVKRLLQMLGMYQPPFICGALYLLGEVSAFGAVNRSQLNCLSYS